MASVADYNVANASGAAVRSDLNNIFQAVVTLNSGTSEPSTMYPFMIWVDTTNNVVKMRNGANDAWLTMPFAMNASNSVDINAGTIDGVSLGATSAITSAVISGDLTVDTSTLKVDSANNRVGIGASPSFHVDIQKSLSETYSASARPTALTRIYNTNTADNNHATLEFGTEPTSGNGGVAYIGSTVTGSNLADLFFGTRTGASTFATHMTIKSDGKTGINTTSPSQLLHVSDTGSAGIYLEADSDNVNEDHVALFHMSSDGGATYHKLGTNNNNHGYINVSEALIFERQGSEKMRMDSSGRLLVGATSVYIDSTDKLVVSGGRIAATVASAQSGAFNRNTSTGDIIALLYNGSGKGSISTDGSNVAYNTSSDARLKNVLGKAKGLDIVNQLNPVHFEWKETGKTQDGLIAQEVEPLIPESVSTNEQTGFYEMDYSKLVTPLIKAVQEQQEQIEELKQQINELKGN